MKKITVVYVPVDGQPEVREIDNTLKALQEVVGGRIEAIPLLPDLTIIINEEGLILNLRHNVLWRGHYLRGDVLVTKGDEDGEFVSLSPEEIEFAVGWASSQKPLYPFWR